LDILFRNDKISFLLRKEGEGVCGKREKGCREEGESGGCFVGGGPILLRKLPFYTKGGETPHNT